MKNRNTYRGYSRLLPYYLQEWWNKTAEEIEYWHYYWITDYLKRPEKADKSRYKYLKFKD